MKRSKLLFVSTAALLAAACASTAPKAPTAALPSVAHSATAVVPGKTPTSAVKPTKPASAQRMVRVIHDPAPAVKQSVPKYWDYGRDAPFEVDDYQAATTAKAGASAVQKVDIKAEVTLPSVAAHKLHLLQALGGADAAATGSADDAATADAAASDEMAASDAADADEPATDDAMPSDGTDAEDSFASAADSGDQADADAESPDEMGDDPAFPSRQQLASESTGKHQVDLDIDQQPVSSNDDTTVTATDEATGQALTIAYDAEWTHFSFTSEDGSLNVEFNPDDSYTVDGQTASGVKGALPLVLKSAVVTKASPYTIAMLAARVGRLAPQASRMHGQGNSQYRIVAAGATNAQARAFVFTDAVLKALLKNAASAKP